MLKKGSNSDILLISCGISAGDLDYAKAGIINFERLSNMQTTGVILAGGKSSRIGVKKAFLKINNKTIIDNMIYTYKKLFNEIIIVTNTPEDYEYLGVKLIEDAIPDMGAMGGLYTGILCASNASSFVAACDMPFINEKLIKYIAGIGDYDAVVPVVNGYYEPLFALYSKNILEVFKEQMLSGNVKIIDAYPKIRVKEVHIEELKKYDSELDSIININTPEDYNSVLSRVKR